MSIRSGSVSETPGRMRESEEAAAPNLGQESVIDAASSFDGLFHVGNHLRIEGTAKGEIQCDGTLTVAEGANVSAKVSAVNVVVAGTLSGETTCRERLQILPSGRVSGTVHTGSLVIQEGAFYEGDLHMQTAPATTASIESARPQPGAARLAPVNNQSRNRGGNGGGTPNGRANDKEANDNKA